MANPELNRWVSAPARSMDRGYRPFPEMAEMAWIFFGAGLHFVLHFVVHFVLLVEWRYVWATRVIGSEHDRRS